MKTAMIGNGNMLMIGNQTDENGDDWEWEYVDDENLTTENGNNK